MSSNTSGSAMSAGSNESTQSTHLSVTERNHRLAELAILQRGALHDRTVNEGYLIEHDWNVQAAYYQWRDDRDAIIAEHADPTPSSTSTPAQPSASSDESEAGSPTVQTSASGSGSATEDNDEVPASHGEDLVFGSFLPTDNIEEERRQAARLVFAMADEDNTDQDIELSISEAVLILLLSNWDLQQVKQRLANINDTRAVLSERFDRMRTPANSVDQDERLATLMQITQRPDWYSVQTFLEKENWNLMEAIVTWYKTGIEVTPHPKDKAKNQTAGMGRRRDHNDQALPMPADNEVVPQNTEDEVEWAPEPSEFVAGGSQRTIVRPKSTGKNKDRQPGFLIDDDSTPIHKGAEKPMKFQIEYFQKKKYHQNIFKHSKFNWDQKSSSSSTNKRPVFDWSKQEDIEVLNNWHRQTRQRVTFSNIREPSQRFSQEELDFLYNLFAQHLKAVMKKSPGKAKKDLLPLRLSKQTKDAWTKAYNDKFAGKQYGVHKEPIRPRKQNALITQCHRYKKLQQDFQLTPDNTRGGKKTAGVKRKRNGGSDGNETEDGGEESAGDSDE